MNVNHGTETQRKDAILVTFRKGARKKKVLSPPVLSRSFRKEMIAVRSEEPSRLK